MSVVPVSDIHPIVPGEVVRRGEQVAQACRAIVVQCSMALQGKRYIKAEGWQALAAANGLSPRISVVEELDGGDIRAVCDLVRLSDGEIVASSEGYVGVDEPMWARRPKYARRAMAQTRATSRACRSALAWVVPLLNAGLETTPAEEMPHDEVQHVTPPNVVPVVQATAPVVVSVEPARTKAEGMATKAQGARMKELHEAAVQKRPDLIKPWTEYLGMLREDYEIKTKQILSGLTEEQAQEVIDHLAAIVAGAAG